jgi:hypothetical protein
MLVQPPLRPAHCWVVATRTLLHDRFCWRHGPWGPRAAAAAAHGCFLYCWTNQTIHGVNESISHVSPYIQAIEHQQGVQWWLPLLLLLRPSAVALSFCG